MTVVSRSAAIMPPTRLLGDGADLPSLPPPRRMTSGCSICGVEYTGAIKKRYMFAYSGRTFRRRCGLEAD